jgi:hypothetical protein
LLVGVGVFGTLPVVLAFLRWSGTVWKAARLPENIPILVPCLGYTLCFLLDNFGDLLRYFHTPMMFFGLMLGISIKVALLPPEHVGSSRNRKVANLPPPAD